MGGLFGSQLLAELNQATANNNLWICGYSDSSPANQTPIAASTCSTYPSLYPASSSWITTGSTIAARVAQIPWYAVGPYANPQTGDYHLVPSSAYNSGGAQRASDGLAVGVNADALNAAQGQVQNVHFIPSTSTLVWFAAPNDSAGCSVDYAATNGFITGSAARSTATTVSASVGALGAYGSVQTAALSGHGFYRINCQTQQPTGTF
jgi:hypothetical protein